jgi:hypothetical protein
MSSPFTEADIRTLLASSASPSLVPKFEEYLLAACNGTAPYVFDAVRMLIKLYQLFPLTLNVQNIGYACLLALVEGYCQDMNTTDLLAISYLLPPTSGVVLVEPCATIFQCYEHLTNCHFTEFWKAYEGLHQNNTDPRIQQAAKDRVPALQQAILGVLALTFKEAPTSTVLKALNVENVAAVLALKSPTVVSASDTSVVFVGTPDNTKRQRVYHEGVSFNAVSSLLNKMAQ